MTIPNIHGKNDGIKIIKSDQIQPTQELDGQTPAEETEDKDIQENNEQKEYSVKQFRKDYRKLLYEKVLPKVYKYEKERKTRLTIALVFTIILSIMAIIVFVKVPGRGAGDLAGLLIGLIILGWHWLKKSFEKKIKRKIMPTLMNAVPGFYWLENPPVTKEDISKSMIFPFDRRASKTFDDCFIGKYRGVDVEMSECKYTITQGKHTYTVFQGVVIRFKMNKSFEGLTVVRPNNVGYSDYSDLKKIKLEQVRLEDPEFDKKFTIYSTDQIESRYLLTTSFMERFKNLTTAFASEGTFCSFCDDYVYIAPYCNGDMFDLFSLTKSVSNSQQFETLFNEFVSILQFVDYFKLDKKLGL